ncbi:hypothetical protein [Laspinema olomoucense]|uniref:hypothetical protein n=1 Tax=Laspinema olomoucense TaxID=3231600 RepID=UPI0021BA7744|nr:MULTISPECIES: hypothetical protein [unclassified Laspinema]MCT7974208.1 hypothetical protein [Laspinema sp. D3d]MCT7994475.1 hypothetical protein [Laspinema sp. D3c]
MTPPSRSPCGFWVVSGVRGDRPERIYLQSKIREAVMLPKTASRLLYSPVSDGGGDRDRLGYDLHLSSIKLKRLRSVFP